MKTSIKWCIKTSSKQKLRIHSCSILVAIVQSGWGGADDIEVPYTANRTLCASPCFHPCQNCRDAEAFKTGRRHRIDERPGSPAGRRTKRMKRTRRWTNTDRRKRTVVSSSVTKIGMGILFHRSADRRSVPLRLIVGSVWAMDDGGRIIFHLRCQVSGCQVSSKQ